MQMNSSLKELELIVNNKDSTKDQNKKGGDVYIPNIDKSTIQ